MDQKEEEEGKKMGVMCHNSTITIYRRFHLIGGICKIKHKINTRMNNYATNLVISINSGCFLSYIIMNLVNNKQPENWEKKYRDYVLSDCFRLSRINLKIAKLKYR